MRERRFKKPSVRQPAILITVVLVLAVTLTVLWNFVLAHDYAQLKKLAGAATFHTWFIVLGSALFLAIIVLMTILGIQLIGNVRRSQRQSSFLASVSHELNSPLSSIKLFAQTLRQKDLSPENQASFAAKILVDTDRLSRIVANIVRAAEVDRVGEELTVAPTEVDLRVYLAEFVEDAKALYAGEVELTLTGDEAYVEIDPLMFRQVLDNLIDNALRYRGDKPARVTLRLESHVEMIRRDLDLEPDRTIDAPCPELEEGVTVAARVRELERDLKLMGPINPLALEEFEALQERHEFLQEQLDDVRSSRRELTKVIRAIDAEIVNVFRAAFVDVAQNFTQLFSTLFPGGEGSLRLTEPDDLLATGIEIQARPSGKNVKKLSLLSGGERSLTALAYLFAVFRSRPSPFYVMDEVEAALDDVNLHRFLQLVDDFRQDAQLMIVSHQKRTMEAADVLYGVTMQPGGSSKVVAERQPVDIDLTREPADVDLSS